MNNIELAQFYTKQFDKRYRKKSLTAALEMNETLTKSFNEKAGTILIPSMTLNGLGEYDRNATDAFPGGSVTLTWESFTIDNDRAMSFQVDSQDNEESGGKTVAQIAIEFMDNHVIPEVDAIRFARMASKGTTTVNATLADGNAVWTAIKTAARAMDEAEVPEEERFLYISNESYYLLEDADKLSFTIDVDKSGKKVSDTRLKELDGMEIIKVPSARFNTGITLNDGTGDVWGYTKSGQDINFQIVHKKAVGMVTRHAKTRVFDADTNQRADADLWQYRILHDAVVPANKTDGIYTHAKPVV